jgi:hypothetical protein
VDVSYCFVFQPYGSDDETRGLDGAELSGLDSGAIEKVVASKQKTILACYEGELASAPNLAAELELSWTIAPSGRVSSASITERTVWSRPSRGGSSPRSVVSR